MKKLKEVRFAFLLLAMNIGCTLNIDAQDDQVKTTDSTFINHSRPIIFNVNKIFVTDEDRKWITDSLIPELKALGKDGIVIGRAAASPEGPSDNNLRLANNRKAAVNELLNSYGISTDRIRYDVVAEDYQLTRSLMWLKHDKYLPAVDSLMWRHYGYSTSKVSSPTTVVREPRSTSMAVTSAETYMAQETATTSMPSTRRDIPR